jgi:hypothetical protein
MVDLPESSTYGHRFHIAIRFEERYQSGVWVRTFILNTSTLQIDQPKPRFFLISELEKTSSSAKDSVLQAWNFYKNRKGI